MPLKTALGPYGKLRQCMEVRIVEFPETKVAVAEHNGAPEFEYETSKKLIEWRIQNRVPSANHQTYGIHEGVHDSVSG